jgi:dihydrofolate synthase / folylpolyglutamate synthase
MTYAEALRWLESLESLGIRPGLERITALLARLGHPHRDLPSILVAGTNGKGSVVAFLAAILAEAGITAGVYTSPHLVRFEERVRVGDEPIPAADLAGLTHEVADAVEAERRAGGPPPTYFEATTALAFLHFARRRVPIAVLEIGMGGRYDATNVVQPLACAITPVSLDHTQWLGRTVAEIARQKAGILKPGVPAVIGRQDREAMAVLRAEAGSVGASIQETAACLTEPAVGEAPGFSDPASFSLALPDGARYPRLDLNLRGDHQVDNAIAAVLLARVLGARGFAAIDDLAIARGLPRATWPGRLELLEGALGAGGPDLLLDGAHNPAGCEILAAYLTRHQAARPRRVLLFAAMRDKPAAAMLEILKPASDAVVLTSLPVARGTPPADLARVASAAGFRVAVEPEPATALERARDLASPAGLVVASGSLYLVGEIRRRLVPEGR